MCSTQPKLKCYTIGMEKGHAVGVSGRHMTRCKVLRVAERVKAKSGRSSGLKAQRPKWGRKQ